MPGGEVGPITTLHAFLLQVLHGNTACSQVVRLASLSCTAEAYCQARARIPLGVYQRMLDETSRAARHGCATPRWLSRQTYEALPEKIVVRELRYFTKLKGGRTRILTLVTTLVDPDQYPAQAVAELYGQRWQIETNLAYLKTILRMDVLRCKTVEGVRKELTIFAIVYNLTRLVMWKAAGRQRVRAQRVSFVDALRWLAEACRQPTLALRLILNPHRPGRHQPRVRKRRPKEYDLMKQPRRQLRQHLYAKRVRA